MKSIYSSFILFIAMIFIMTFSVNYLKKTCTSLISFSGQLENEISSDSWKKAYKDSIKLMERWKKDSDTVSIFVHHQEIDELNNEIWKLTQHVKCENKADALASIHAVKFLISHIIDLEKINIQNLL